MADIQVTIEDAQPISVNVENAQPINVSLGEAVNIYPGGSNISDHSQLTGIGINTHAQIDAAIDESQAHIANNSNPHQVTKAQIGLSNVPNTDFTAAVAANTAKRSYPQADQDKLSTIESGAQVNTVQPSDLSLKADKSNTYTKIEVDTSLAGKAEAVHVHTISQVTGLQSALDGKSSTSHNHDERYYTESEVDSLIENIDTTPSEHTHVEADITDLGDYATTAELTSGLATKSNTTHNHTLASLTEKSYNSLTDRPSLFDGAYSSLSGTPSTFTPSAHTHGVGDINATGTASSTTYLRGDGTWSTVSGGGATDHSALTGLANDDHTQYLLANGTRTLSGTLTLTNSSVNGGDAHIRTVGNKGLQIQRGDTTPATFRLLPNGNDIYFQNTGTGGIFFSGLNATTMTGDVIFVTSGAMRANANLVATSGTSTRYWANTFTQTLNLNASASLSGTTAGTMNMVATNIAVNGTNGATGSFTTADSKTVTVTKGIITAIA